MLLFIISALEGFTTLALEILGIRLFSPYFGLSSPVVSIIISVVLAGLAFGYWLGGVASFHYPRWRLVCWALVSMLGTIVIALFGQHVLEMLTHLGSMTGTVVGALGLFFVPSMAFAAIAPTAVALLSERMAADVASGIIFALSTVGAIVGSLMSSFVMLPYLGIQTSLVICVAVSTLIVALALRSRLAIAPLSIGLVAGMLALRSDANEIVYESTYNHLMVRQDMGLARLYVNEGFGHHSSAIDPDTGLAGGYHDAVVALTLALSGGRILVLGNGGGTVTAQFERLGVDYLGVEIDEVMTSIGLNHLGLRFDPSKVRHVDARIFVRESDERFSAIHVDLFAGNPDIPPHVASREFFLAISERLAPRGVVFVNFPAVLRAIPIACNYVQAALSVFPYGYATDQLLVLGNHDMLGQPLDLSSVPPRFLAALRQELVLAQPLQHNRSVEIFTDDWAPTFRFTSQLQQGYSAVVSRPDDAGPIVPCLWTPHVGREKG